MSENIQFDVKKLRALLVEHRNELLDIAEVGKDSRRPVELDQARVGRLSRMDALQDQAMAVETDRRRNLEISRIEEALKRLETGEYGYCTSCGEAIAPKRLQFDPATPLCIDCAAKEKG